MKIVITEEQKKLIKESTNRSAKLLGKFYDIEADGAYYLGDGMIQSRVRFTPKDFDNPMTPQYGESVCNWKIDKPFSSTPGENITFAAMNLPDSFNVPLMDHIGNTEELEKYLKGLHMEEVEEFIKRIIERRNNPLKESVDKNKKFLTNVMGYDFTNKIKKITSSYAVPMSFGEGVSPEIIRRWLNHWGPMYLVNINGKKYLYQDRGDFEMFIDEEGYDYVDDEIPEELGISDMGLKFSDIIDMFHNDEVPLNESVDRKKKLFIDLLGQDLIDSIRTITSPKELPKEFSKSLGSSRIKAYIDAYGPLYYFVFEGEPFIYKDRVSPKGEEYEMFVNRKGESFFNNQISNRLGLSDVGLKFLDVINTFHNDEEPLNESIDKNKKFLTNVMGQDFTGKIKEVKDPYDVPLEFGETIGDDYIRRVLNYFGPLHLVDIDGKKYLYQYRTDEEDGDYEWFHDEHGFNYVDGEIPEQLGLNELGLKFSDIIDMFYNQEGEPLNEEENDKPDWLRENTKVKNLLKKLFENKEYDFSFKDKWEDLDGHIETYTFHYHIEILNAIGVGSDTIARVQVIIDDILLDGESVYDGWVEIGYSNNVWYINNLENHLDEEFFDVFPFSIYVNFYGHDEKK